MAKRDIARMTPAEHREFLSWARRYGSSWKKQIRQRRMDGRLEGPAATAFNKIGPSGLIAYRLTMANVENPGRKRPRKAAKKAPARKRAAPKQRNPRGVPKDAADRWTIRSVRLNSGGYDRFGEYFGRGAPLFSYEGQLPAMKSHLYGEYGPSSVGRDVYGHVRASDRAAAIVKVKQKYPDAKFYGERKVANPAKKRNRPWRVTVARDGGSLSVASHVYEFVDAPNRESAMKAALKRHDRDARIVSLTPID